MRSERREVDALRAAVAVSCGAVRPEAFFRGEYITKNAPSSELRIVRVNTWRPERPVRDTFCPGALSRKTIQYP